MAKDIDGSQEPICYGDKPTLLPWKEENVSRYVRCDVLDNIFLIVEDIGADDSEYGFESSWRILYVPAYGRGIKTVHLTETDKIRLCLKGRFYPDNTGYKEHVKKVREFADQIWNKEEV